MNRGEYEKRTALLIGRTIVRVTYHEIDYGDGRFHFFDDPRFDSLDFGLELVLDSLEVVTITWGAEFQQYGVSVCAGSMSTGLPSSLSLDVTDTTRWQSLIGRSIESAEFHWSWFQETDRPETCRYYPQDLLIQFAGKRSLVISALESRDGDWHMGMMDNITVFDDIELARRFHCLKPD